MTREYIKPRRLAAIIAIILATMILMLSCSPYYNVSNPDKLSVTFTDINTLSWVEFKCDSAVHKKGEVWLYTNGLVQKINVGDGVIVSVSKNVNRK